MTNETAIEILDIWRKIPGMNEDMPTHKAVIETAIAALREREKVAALIEACKEWVKIRGDGCGLKCGECFHPTGHSSNCLLRPIKSALAAFDAPPEGGSID